MAFAAEDVAGLAVLPMGAILFGALAVECEGLTLEVPFPLCCAKPFTLILANTTATAKENLMFNPLLWNFEPPVFRARTLPYIALTTLLC